MLLHYASLSESMKEAISALRSLSVQTHAHTIINHILAAHAIARSYLDEVSDKYQSLTRIISGTGSILDIIPLPKQRHLINNVTEQLPAKYYVRPVPDDRIDIRSNDQLIISPTSQSPQRRSSNLYLNGTGILKLDERCILKTAHHTISGSFILDMRVRESFVREVPRPKAARQSIKSSIWATQHL